MRLVAGLFCLAFLVSAQDPYRVAGDHYHLAFENAWARASLVTYGPHETAPVHDHSMTPTAIYVYLTDAGPLRFTHMTGMKIAGEVITRPAVKAGEIRFGHSARETHSSEYLGDTPMKYVRIELRTEMPDAVIRSIHIQPPVMASGKSAVLKEFENGQVRILRVVCAAGDGCPASENPDDPAIVTVMNGPDQGAVRWCPSAEKGPLDEVRIELKTPPVAPRN